MKYKLIVADFDNTLVGESKKITQRTKKALDAFIAAGGFFTIATGRITTGMMANMDIIPINAPLITYQGAEIVDCKGKEILYADYINVQTSASVASDLLRFNLDFNAYIDNEICVQNIHPHLINYCMANKQGYLQFDDIVGHILANQCRCKKFLTIMEWQKAIEYEKIFTEKYPSLSITRSTSTFLEFNSKNAQKGKAVDFVGKYLGIKREEIICFGDSTNDSSMVEYAGLGVAMGNAMPELKAIADIVADDVERDGLAKIIEQYCL